MTQIGVIIGTGTNACYMEQIERIPKLYEKLVDDGLPDEIVMNLEWGAFGDDGSLKFVHTRFDQEVDSNSINPGKQIFEKMISGMYLGEVVRTVLKELAQQGLLLGGQTAPLLQKGRFSTRFISDIQSDANGGEEERATFQNTQKILGELGFTNLTRADCANVFYVCSVVSA
ncbi:Hexokinase, partial [Ostertagia ostertagi]